MFVEKEEIAKDIKEELTKSMSGYGRFLSSNYLPGFEMPEVPRVLAW